MKIGIFGGSFNPPHKMHSYITSELLKQHYVDKIIFVPTGSKYEYKHNLVEDKYRLDMLNLITKNNCQMEVSDYELKDYVVHTIDTLTYFKDKFPNADIYFICGTDNLSYIDKWANGYDILKNYKIIVINREGNDINELLNKYREYKDNIIIASIPLSDMSSTKIRELIRHNKVDELNKYLEPEVISYIIDNELYREDI